MYACRSRLVTTLAIAAILPVATACGPDCEGGPQTSVLKDEDIFGNAIDSGGWCDVQFLDNPIELGIKYIITGDTQGNPIEWNWTFPPGSTPISGETSTYPAIRLGSESGEVTAQAHNACGESSVATRSITVLTTDALSKLPDVNLPERYGAASFALDGFGYAIGGTNFNGEFLNDVWRFDPETFTWTQIDDAPTSTGGELGLATTAGDKAYVLLKEAFYRFEPPGTWTLIGDLPFASVPSFITNAGGFIFLGEQALHGGTATVWQFDPSTGEWTAPAAYASVYERVFGFSLHDTLYLGAGCNTCDTSSPTLGADWVGFDPATQSPNGLGFTLQSFQFESWTLNDSVVITNETGRYVYRPETGPIFVPANPAMICPLPVAFIGDVGHTSFAIGDAAFRAMGYRPDPPAIATGVERYIP